MMINLKMRWFVVLFLVSVLVGTVWALIEELVKVLNYLQRSMTYETKYSSPS